MLNRFFSKINKTDSCWIWISATSHNGYGVFWLNGGNIRAHRLSYKIHNGDIPEYIHVLHRCDNRICVNPDHLFLGTHSDNMKDMVIKKRHYRQSITHCPSNHPYSKENTRLSNRGSRLCLECDKIKHRELRVKFNNRFSYICKSCSTEFTSYTKNRKFCSTKCSYSPGAKSNNSSLKKCRKIFENDKRD